MKKLLTSALLTGLLLGVASPVFAADAEPNEINNIEPTAEPTDAVGSTEVTSTITATYSVTIPSNLSINLMDDLLDNNKEGNIILDDLTAAGQINVTAEVENLVLSTVSDPLSPQLNEELITTLVGGTQDTPNSTSFSLSNNLIALPVEQSITIGTAEVSKDNIAGTYKGNINFTFNYEASPAGNNE